MPSPRALAAATTLLAALAGTAHADRRSLTHTYEYMTMPRGETELEFYSTQARLEDEGPGPAGREYEFMIEVEHGITERWDVSLYQVFQQATDVGLHYAETKLRSRYRLAERGELPVDVLFYGEIAKAFAESEWELEGKVILAKDFGPLTAVANLIGEIKLEKEGDERESELIPAFAAGVVYEVAPSFTVGAEAFGELEQETEPSGEEETELELAVGPAMSWAPTPDLWFASTLAFGVEHAAELELRFILGLHL